MCMKNVGLANNCNQLAEQMHLVLLETAPNDRPGSMRQYGGMLEEAIQRIGWRVSRENLAMPQVQLNRFPGPCRSVMHHACITWRAHKLRRLRGSNQVHFHIVDGSHAYIASAFPTCSITATSHDILPYLQMKGHFQSARVPSLLGRRVITRSLKGLREVARVMSDSHSTKNDLVTHAKVDVSKIEVIHLPLKSTRNPSSARSVSKHPFLLHVGNNGFYKNRAGVLRIFGIIHAQFPIRLVMVGPEPTVELRNLAESLGISASVEFVTDPTDEKLTELYRHAALLLFPSLYEGYGWPPLEAMQAGCAVVSSDAGSLAEVLEGAAITCNPNDEACFAKECLRVLNDEQLRFQLCQRGLARVKTLDFDTFCKRVETFLAPFVAAGRTN